MKCPDLLLSCCDGDSATLLWASSWVGEVHGDRKGFEPGSNFAFNREVYSNWSCVVCLPFLPLGCFLLRSPAQGEERLKYGGNYIRLRVESNRRHDPL
jgi:hypothetical protein